MFSRTDVLLKRLRASRLDNSHDTEIRKLVRVDLLVLDDFALQPMDALDTADIYELIVERHRASSTVVTSNREPNGSASSRRVARPVRDRPAEVRRLRACPGRRVLSQPREARPPGRHHYTQASSPTALLT